jgi:hypothetical protein
MLAIAAPWVRSVATKNYWCALVDQPRRRVIRMTRGESSRYKVEWALALDLPPSFGIMNNE